MSAQVTEVNDATFAAEVLQSDKPVLVDFWAEWCGPCKAVAPVVEDIAQTYGDRLKVVKVNIEESPNTQKECAIRGIPTLMLFKNGAAAATQVGAAGKAQVSKMVEEHIA